VEAQAGQPDPDNPDPGRPERGDAFVPAADPSDPGSFDLNVEDEGPFYAWLPPEDRLWRHPSESRADSARTGTESHGAGAGATSGPDPVRTWRVAITAGLCGALAATGLGVVGGWWHGRTETVIRSIAPVTSSVTLAATGTGGTNWSAVDDTVAPSVVSLMVSGPSGPQEGSGLVIATTENGYAYVVTDRSLFAATGAAGYPDTTTVTFLSGAEARGRLVGEDQLSGLALVEVSDVPQVSAPPTGTVAEMHDADPVMVVGSRSAPGGSVFTGSVSGEDRRVLLGDGTDMDNLIALSVPALAPAEAGGPLLDASGRVVGLTVDLQPVDGAAQQSAFAVPIDEVTRVATQLIEGQRVTHAWLGISDAEDVPSAMARQYGLTGGAQAGEVTEGSPAGRVGMRSLDIVSSFDGKPVTSTGALIADLQSMSPGRPVDIGFIHAGRSVHATVTLGEEPADAD
jgi:putative serine protease PepD